MRYIVLAVVAALFFALAPIFGFNLLGYLGWAGLFLLLLVDLGDRRE